MSMTKTRIKKNNRKKNANRSATKHPLEGLKFTVVRTNSVEDIDRGTQVNDPDPTFTDIFEIAGSEELAIARYLEVLTGRKIDASTATVGFRVLDIDWVGTNEEGVYGSLAITPMVSRGGAEPTPTIGITRLQAAYDLDSDRYLYRGENSFGEYVPAIAGIPARIFDYLEAVTGSTISRAHGSVHVLIEDCDFYGTCPECGRFEPLAVSH